MDSLARLLTDKLPVWAVVILVLVALAVGLASDILPPLINNQILIDIANRETHIAETLVVADLTLLPQTVFAATLTSFPSDAQRTEISNRETRAAATFAAIRQTQTEQADTVSTRISGTDQTPWIVTATLSPTPSQMPIPEVSANRPWNSNPVIRQVFLPNTNIPVNIALVPRPATGYFDMAHDEREAIEMPYWIDVTEVTRGQLRECQLQFGCSNNDSDALESNVQLSDNHPVSHIKLDEAREYCAWRGGSLPTEVQWEYAARGPSGWEYPNNIKNTEDVVWRGNQRLYPDRMAYAPLEVAALNDISWVGASDMLGNVIEWTKSLFSISEGRYVIKGSAFSIEGEPNFRFSRRDGKLPTARLNDLGFRCVFAYNADNQWGLP